MLGEAIARAFLTQSQVLLWACRKRESFDDVLLFEHTRSVHFVGHARGQERAGTQLGGPRVVVERAADRRILRDDSVLRIVCARRVHLRSRSPRSSRGRRSPPLRGVFEGIEATRRPPHERVARHEQIHRLARL